MKNFTQLSFLLIFISALRAFTASAQVPNWNWAQSASYGTPRSIATDKDGYVYVTGNFEGATITFGSTVLTNTNTGTSDMFIAKFNGAGNLIWVRQFGGVNHDYITAVAADNNGNVYIAGGFLGPVTFGGIVLSSTGSNMFITKLDGSGSVVWARNVEGGSWLSGNSIAIDDVNHSDYVTGSFQADSLSFGGSTIYKTGIENIFITKYDFSGNEVWIRGITGDGWDWLRSVATDEVGNIYIAGKFGSSVLNFDGTTLTNINSANGSDGFFAKYSPSGSLLWAKRAGGYQDDGFKKMSLDKHGNIYLCGDFHSGTVSFDGITVTGNAVCQNSFIAKYSVSGDVIWAKGLSGNYNNNTSAIKNDQGGNSYLMGNFNTSIMIGNDTLQAVSNTFGDIYMAKYDSSGAILWAKSWGGDSEEEIMGLDSDSNENLYATGYTFSPDWHMDGHPILNPPDSAGYHGSLFVAKFGNTCSYPLSQDKAIGAAGGDDSLSVSALSGCDWMAVSNDNWITISSVPNGSGHGRVKYTVTGNPGTNSRMGTIDVEGSVYTVTQAGMIVTGITEKAIRTKVSVYPNPFSSTANISITNNLTETKNLSFSLYDLLGRKQNAYVLFIRKEKDEIMGEIRKGNLQSGIYLYFVNNGEEVIGRGLLEIKQ